MSRGLGDVYKRQDHRQGTGCVYCENTAFSPHSRTVEPRPALDEQLARGIRFGEKRYRARGFFAYFQAYTNTYGPVKLLEERYGLIRRYPEVVGLAVGTRPDCTEEPVLDLLESFSQDYEVWVEYGLQSAHNRTLDRIRRGHRMEDFLDAVERTSRRPIQICAHIILGIPGESHEMMMQTAEEVGRLGFDAVKIHNLYAVKGTPLGDQVAAGEIRMMNRDHYVTTVADFLERIPAEVIVERVSGDAPSSYLIEPRWCLEKSTLRLDIERELARRGTRQGSRFMAPRIPPAHRAVPEDLTPPAIREQIERRGRLPVLKIQG